MNCMKIVSIVGAVIFTLALHGCGKSSEDISPQQKAIQEEQSRRLSTSLSAYAQSLATDRKHDKTYYEDRLTQIAINCAKNSDASALSACLDLEFDSLKRE